MSLNEKQRQEIVDSFSEAMKVNKNFMLAIDDEANCATFSTGSMLSRSEMLFFTLASIGMHELQDSPEKVAAAAAELSCSNDQVRYMILGLVSMVTVMLKSGQINTPDMLVMLQGLSTLAMMAKRGNISPQSSDKGTGDHV